MKNLFLILLVAGGVSADAATGIEKIFAYEGTWKSEIERFATAYSKASKESTTLRNECWHSAGYFACDQFVNGESKGLIVFTYNAKDDTYNNYSVPVDGGPANSGTLRIKDNVWTFPWEDKDTQGKPVYFQVVNVFAAPGTIEYRMEFSSDKAHWTVAARGIEKKQ